MFALSFHSPRSLFALLVGVLFCSGLLFSVGCSGEVDVTQPGCVQCPDRCATVNGKAQCVTCVNDEQCRSDVSPTKRCDTERYRCLCGSDKDCSQGTYCNTTGSCVECMTDEHCTTDYQPFCVNNSCEICKANTTRSCKSDDPKACKEGTQLCTNNLSWGACEGATVCAEGERCDNGACVADCSEAPCKEGQTTCMTDANTIPGAFKTCKRNAKGCWEWDDTKVTTCQAGEYCFDGKCASVSCPQGQTKCGEFCVSLSNNPSHCGACNKACQQGELCVQGACQFSCPPGQSKCGATCVDLKTNRNHCGACNKACASGTICTAGACKASCQTGLTLCSSQCVNLQSDVAHCGKCNNPCAKQQVCGRGICTVSCPSGQTNCSGSCVNLSSSAKHCGKCGNACPAGKSCLSGTCITFCQQGQTNCGGTCISTQTNAQHCGKCNNACPSGKSCSNSVCR
ncbi:MAG: hypothetical protein EP343_07455 [Deltaproteobacteria bacterium]|nr:MAG: hypothetical protein EP343_07455 [Deltaproteobacteria bacterium]